MPTEPTPEPPRRFDGFHPTLTLSKDEVLDVIATLEEVSADIGCRDLLDQAEELARVGAHLLSRLQR